MNGDVSPNARSRNNCIGIEIDRTSLLGIRRKLKNYICLTAAESHMMCNAGWNVDGDLSSSSFDICVPHNHLLRFAEDFTKVICNIKNDLILLRSANDANVSYSTDPSEVIRHFCYF